MFVVSPGAMGDEAVSRQSKSTIADGFAAVDCGVLSSHLEVFDMLMRRDPRQPFSRPPTMAMTTPAPGPVSMHHHNQYSLFIPII